jgi:hypothetical protein
LQISALKEARFCLKIRAILQKNGGPTEIILHFFSRFSGFSGFSLSQAIAFQCHPAIQPLQKKSCLKSYRRFFVRFGMCHNRRMNDEKFDGRWAGSKEPSGNNIYKYDAGILAAGKARRRRISLVDLRLGSNAASRQKTKSDCKCYFLRAPNPPHGDRPANAASKDPQFTAPAAAIQPGPMAVGTSQYK